jgi:glycosyltransferase involved in cell wall biosynthesis
LRCSFGLSFVKASFATQSRSPTKIPEYLAAGLPIIANAGVGDVDQLVNGNNVGTLLEGFSAAEYNMAIDVIEHLGDIGDRCRKTARREFDLETVGGARYRRLYDKLSGSE